MKLWKCGNKLNIFTILESERTRKEGGSRIHNNKYEICPDLGCLGEQVHVTGKLDNGGGEIQS